MWRPEGYHKAAAQVLLQYERCELTWPQLITGLESAMLEALKARGLEVSLDRNWLLTEPMTGKQLSIDGKGHLVFIPDEEQQR